jgi:hypothetical protein
MKWGSTAPTHAGWYRARAPKHVQPVTVEESRGMADSAWSIFSRIATGLGLYAAVGWLFSLWLGHAPELIAAGASVDEELIDGSTYLHHASRMGSAEIVQPAGVDKLSFEYVCEYVTELFFFFCFFLIYLMWN